MTMVALAEIMPGLVVHLDATMLKLHGGSRTNAERTITGDRAVEGPHYFLVLETKDQMALTIPLFGDRAPGSECLQEELKGGYPDRWIGEKSWFSHWQHWWIPFDALRSASKDDEGNSGCRRTYAIHAPDELAKIARWMSKNRAEWRSV